MITKTMDTGALLYINMIDFSNKSIGKVYYEGEGGCKRESGALSLFLLQTFQRKHRESHIF